MSKVSGLTKTPVAFVTDKDSYRDPVKLREDLKIPGHLETSKLGNKDFQDSVALGKPSATPAGNSSGVCAVSLPSQTETVLSTFNRMAHADPRAGPQKLGIDPNAPDLTAIAHEVGHCDQEPIAKNDPRVTEKVLAAEVDADNKAKAAFPEYASVIDGGRALGGQHDAMKGDYDHAVSLHGASGGKLSAEEISNTYEVLNQRIGKQYAHDPRADPERTDSALRYALEPDNMFDKAPLTQEGEKKLESARDKIGSLPATEILEGIPPKIREEQGIDANFYRKTAENMPSDPRLISGLIKKIDPTSMGENEKMAAGIYTDAADRIYPPETGTSSVPAVSDAPQQKANIPAPAAAQPAGMGMR